MYDESRTAGEARKPARCCKNAGYPGQSFGRRLIHWKDPACWNDLGSPKKDSSTIWRAQSQRRIPHPGEGGAAPPTARAHLANGSELRFWDPRRSGTGRLPVNEDGRPLAQLPELEWSQGRKRSLRQRYQTDASYASIPHGQSGRLNRMPRSADRDRPQRPDAFSNAFDPTQRPTPLVTANAGPKLFRIQPRQPPVGQVSGLSRDSKISVFIGGPISSVPTSLRSPSNKPNWHTRAPPKNVCS